MTPSSGLLLLMFSSTGRRLFTGGFRTCRRFFTSGDPKKSKNIYGYFDDRTLGLLTLLVTVPTVRITILHYLVLTILF